jgi:hypothetical protein
LKQLFTILIEETPIFIHSRCEIIALQKKELHPQSFIDDPVHRRMPVGGQHAYPAESTP